MMNYYKSMLDRLGSLYMSNDDIVPPVKYGVAPPTYMNTDPRFDQRPNSQATPASGRNSSMAPNPQAGRTLFGNSREHLNINRPITGDIEPSIETAVYRNDPRVKDVDAVKGNTDYQNDPRQGDPEGVRSSQLGYPVVPHTGYESMISVIQIGGVDRDCGEVNTPVIYGDARAYQGSANRYSVSPEWLLGGDNFGPRPSQFYIADELEDPKAHPDQMWVQSHPNQVAHTIGHDHPYGHKDRHYGNVVFGVGRIVPT